MDNLPLVSIIIPTYNRLNLFKMAFWGALRQTYPNIEIIVSDNSTNEDTAEYMQQFVGHSRVTYLRNRNIQTKEENFRAATDYVHGQYINWLMDDDCLKVDKIEKMMRYFLADSAITLVTSRRTLINSDNIILPDSRATMPCCRADTVFEDGKVIGKKLLNSMLNFIGEPSTVLFRRNDLSAENYFSATYRGYRRISDVVMWLDLLKKGKFVYIAEPLSAFRVHYGQEQQQPSVILEGAVEWYRLLFESYNEGFFIENMSEFLTVSDQRQKFSKILQKNLSGYLESAAPSDIKTQFFTYCKISEDISKQIGK